MNGGFGLLLDAATDAWGILSCTAGKEILGWG